MIDNRIKNRLPHGSNQQKIVSSDTASAESTTLWIQIVVSVTKCKQQNQLQNDVLEKPSIKKAKNFIRELAASA